MDPFVQFVLLSAVSITWSCALWVPTNTHSSTSWPPALPTWPTKAHSTTSTPQLSSSPSSVPGVFSTQQSQVELERERLARKQAESAVYSFDSQVLDGIMDGLHVRQETRRGLKLSGAYSYSDGYDKHTVFYEADQNGYRIVKDVTEHIGNGPQVHPDGRADVSVNIDGKASQYSITADDIGQSQTTTMADLLLF